MSRRFVVTIAVLALAPAGVAHAQGSNAPPGNAGVDEYLETVPSSGGNRPLGDGKRGGKQDRQESAGQSQGAVLPATVQQELQSQGADGRTAAELAEATAPARKPAKEAAPALGNEHAGDGSSPFRSVVGAVTGSGGDGGGLGPVLPLLLLATLGIGAALLLAKRRSA